MLTPRNQSNLLRFIEDELGLVFDSTRENIDLLAEHMGCSQQEVLATLTMMASHGVLSECQHGPLGRRWTMNLKVAA